MLLMRYLLLSLNRLCKSFIPIQYPKRVWTARTRFHFIYSKSLCHNNSSTRNLVSSRLCGLQTWNTHLYQLIALKTALLILDYAKSWSKTVTLILPVDQTDDCFQWKALQACKRSWKRENKTELKCHSIHLHALNVIGGKLRVFAVFKGKKMILCMIVTQHTTHRWSR